MEEEFDNIDNTLKTLESTEGRITYALSVLREANDITDEEYVYLANGVLQKDPNLAILSAICKDKTTYREIAEILKAQLQVMRPQAVEQLDDYSPNTQHKFVEALNDSSPLGEMLMYRKRNTEDPSSLGGFSLKMCED